MRAIWIRRRRKWMGAAVAGSLLFHGMLAMLLPAFQLPGRIMTMNERLQKPMRLSDVSMDELPSAAVPALKALTPLPVEPREGGTEVARPGSDGLGGAGDGKGLSFQEGTGEGMLEPRAVGGGVLLGDRESLREPPAAPSVRWEPRQEVVMINRRVVRDELPGLARRFLPETPRVAQASDYVPAVTDRGSAGGGSATNNVWPLFGSGPIGLGGQVEGGSAGAPAGRRTEALRPPVATNGPSTPREAIYRSLEKYLKAGVQVYRAPRERENAYVLVKIERLGPEVLPVLPRDLLFVQDCSASITEQKLHFCREGWRLALRQLRAGDRFNVVAFQDHERLCFPAWTAADPDTLTRAESFVGTMQASGNTDIYRAMRQLLDLQRTPGRPAIAIVVSDGVPTVGMTDSSEVIGQFTVDNDGALSTYALGTFRGVNAYLLDLLSQRNRGDSVIVRSGRWDIPQAIEQRAVEVSRPVLTDVRVRFAGLASNSEFLPTQTMNLYLDRPLLLYGRVPRDTARLVFQVQGRAGDIKCDMVFDLDLTKAPNALPEVRTDWAWQKAYDLIGRHTQTRATGTARELRTLQRAYGIQVPYLDVLGSK
ncbi:MAG: vWA domain-containing protein [Kiritimatiellia bacterium]